MKSLALVSAVATAPGTSSFLKPAPTQNRPESKTPREYGDLDQVYQPAEALLLKHQGDTACGPRDTPTMLLEIKVASANCGSHAKGQEAPVSCVTFGQLLPLSEPRFKNKEG